MRRSIAFLALAAALSGVGCANVTIRSEKPGASAPVKQEPSFMFWGLVGQYEVDLAAVCPTGVSSIHQVATFGDMCISGCTLGIYNPRTVEITCASGKAFKMDVDADGRLTQLVDLDSAEEVLQ